jgi:hypothetical protein
LKKSENKMSERRDKERKLSKLERDLTFLKDELQHEHQLKIRLQILTAIRDVELDILRTLTEIRDITGRENANIERALTSLKKMKKLE